jgi:hypothetical protein
MNSARLHSARLSDLLRREHSAMAEFLLALADFDRHRYWEALGHAGLFAYLHRDLGLSKGAAYQRKTAAELLQRLPEVIEPLRDGRLCLSSIVEVARVVTPENCAAVLPRFFHLSAREAREVTAELCPRADPPLREVVTGVGGAARELTRRLVLTSELAGAGAPAVTLRSPPTPPDAGLLGSSPATAAPNDRSPAPPATKLQGPGHSVATAPATPDSVDPLSADLRRLHLTVSRHLVAKLEAARAGMSHSCPGASAEQVLDAALDLLLAKQARRKGVVEHPRAVPPPSKSDQIPANVRRAVWLRDQGRCQWPVDSGGVCGSTLRPEFDHVAPKGRGGPPTVPNVRVLCERHNKLAARLVYGDRWMARFTDDRCIPAGELPGGP